MKQVLVEKISLWQLAVLIFIFEIGSVAIVGVGDTSKQDAWIAVLLATVLGLFLMLLYIFILTQLPGKNIFEILTFCFGKWLGSFITILYILYFFYLAARVLRDFGELMVTVIFQNTPIEVISITMMLVVAYMLYLGLEVFGRTGEVFLPYVLTFIIGIGFAILFSHEMEFKNLQPVLANGFKPVWFHAFPYIFTFPFGELVAFLVVIPYVTKWKKVRTVTLTAVLASGLMITYQTIITITTLGAGMLERTVFPLLSAAREISLFDFIERVDLIIVFIVMFGIITKVGVFFYAGLKGIQHMTGLPYRYLTYPLSAIVAYCSIKISTSYAEYAFEGQHIIPLYMHIPFQIIIPFILTPFLVWRVKKQQKGMKSYGSS